ncbi:MAG TPA: hypothetical protein VHN39_15185 [Phenylobacterium sp.]|jgi:hypothetical protein|nr:hypothetical protein [Phenylobacterium sp.]
MAKTVAPSPKPAEARPTEVARKAAAVAKKVAGLRADLGLAHGLVHEAQIREALTRTELTLALGEALKGRAQALAGERRLAVQRHLATSSPRPVRRRGRAQRGFDRLMLAAGLAGHARLIADAGVWRGGDLTEMAVYVRRRTDPTAAPATLFDQAWYLETYPEAAASGLAPLVHYLVRGAATGKNPHPLMHADYYVGQNAAALSASQVSPLEHFVREGAARGRNPHPAFDVLHYAAQGPQLAPDEDPASHYLRTGWRDGLSPHPLFDPAWYRRQMPRQAAEIPPLVHYLTIGWREGLSPHPLFDPRWYVEQNPDVAEIGAEPLTHFLTGGAAEGRSPSAWFDLPHYVAARGEALDPAVNPLVDYLAGGAWSVAEARPGFPTAAYLAQSPELVGQGMTPLEHWARKAARP